MLVESPFGLCEEEGEIVKNAESYYRDHWIAIDDERLAAYDQMFRWRPEMDPLIAPAEIGPGQTVLDYGCGPGWLAIELARRVGSAGQVHAVDLNEEFLARGARHAAEEGVADRIRFARIEGDRIPLADRAVDRVVTKNVLEYVPDLATTLGEFHRVLRPDGRLHVVDSDWGMLVVEPIGPEAIAELFGAASMAYKTPLVGRKLYNAMRDAGFRDVRLQILASADTRGHFSPIVRNMASYARESGRLAPAKIDAVVAALDRALADGSYLLVLPQFLVSGVA
jgi:ubiquinone/menaquinone biosynthesis C-methylase UbiE